MSRQNDQTKDKKTKRQKGTKTKRQNDEDQKECLILRHQGNFALLRCLMYCCHAVHALSQIIHDFCKNIISNLLLNYMGVYCEFITDLSSFGFNGYILTLKTVCIISDQPSLPGEDSVWYTFPGHLVIKAHMLGCSVHPRHI